MLEKMVNEAIKQNQKNSKEIKALLEEKEIVRFHIDTRISDVWG